mmetsp:Transcript_16300/g.38272  ORF Transcript_16300/g.38272 Transcript_16300/m.38272 type:complete len:388 (-) Transcript_16300:1632-2795(-)
MPVTVHLSHDPADGPSGTTTSALSPTWKVGGPGAGGATGRSTSPRHTLISNPICPNSGSLLLYASNSRDIATTPAELPSKPNLGKTVLWTERTNFIRSLLNSAEPFLCLSPSSLSRPRKASAENPSYSAFCNCRASSLVSVGLCPGAGLRSSTPISKTLLLFPSASASLKDVKPPLSPTLLTKRPFFTTSGRPSRWATASFSWPSVALLGMIMCSSWSSWTACFTVTSTSNACCSGSAFSLLASSSLAGASASASGASTRPKIWLMAKPLRWNSSSVKLFKAPIMSKTPFWLPSKPNLGSTTLCTVRKSLVRSTLNFLSFVFFKVDWSSFSFLWNSSCANPSYNSPCNCRARSRVSPSGVGAVTGSTTFAVFRLSTPTNKTLRRAPS